MNTSGIHYGLVLLSISTLLALSGLDARGQAPSPDRPTCAILTFQAGAGVSSPEADMLSDRFAIEFDKLGQYKLIARVRMKDLLAVQAFSTSKACAASECAVEAGQMLGVRYMVYGSIGKIGEIYSINSFMVDVETGAQVRSATTDLRCRIEEALTVLMAANAHGLAGLELPPALAAKLTDAFFNVSASPANARVELDGTAIVPGIVAVSPDEFHTISVSLPGYQSATIRRRTAPGSTLDVDVRLEPEYRPPAAQPWPPQRPAPEPPPRKTRDIYVSPRVGLSMSSGLAGLEIQIKNIAVSAGVLPGGPALGARIYFTQDKSSWFIGVCGYSVEEAEQDDETSVTDNAVGALLGYRWRSPGGWELSLGLGVGSLAYTEEEDAEEAESEVMPMIDLAIGYAL